jgi:hemoglobin-like flavoprotein
MGLSGMERPNPGNFFTNTTTAISCHLIEDAIQGLIASLEELLGDKFTSDINNSWFECYQAMSCDMMRAIQKEVMITSKNLI